MAFMFPMIFAFALIAMTTVVATILAVLLMRWMLELGRFVRRVRASTDVFLEVEGRDPRAILQP